MVGAVLDPPHRHLPRRDVGGAPTGDAADSQRLSLAFNFSCGLLFHCPESSANAA